MGPVFEDLESGGDRPRILCRYLEHINGLIEARIGVDRGSECHADRFEVIDEFLLLEVFSAIECHVLDEVSKTELRVVLQDRSGIHYKPEFSTIFRLAVLPDVVAQPVLEFAHSDVWVHR